MTTHERRGDFEYLLLDGITVTMYRDEESGQVFVHIGTEDATRDNDPGDDCPTIHVGLNDADLYDGETHAGRVAPSGPDLRRLWTEAGEHYQGDLRAWAFVNRVLSDIPYVLRTEAWR